MQDHTTQMLSTNIWDRMGLSEINGFNAILIISLLSLVANVSAETTFFDNPDDAFIMGDPTAGGVIGGTTGEGGCTYEWNCTNWSECLPSGKQTRNCTNIGTCSDTYESPEIEQNCTYTASPKVEKEDKEPGNETEKQNETEKTSEKEIVDENRVFLYSIIVLIIGFIILIGFIIFYLKKGYFKKLIKRS
jgi:hypothetical protein